MRAALYLRVSTPRQAAEGLSLDVQEEATRRAALAAGATSTAIYREEGESGKSLDRTQFQRLLRDLPTYDLVCTFALDRLTRSALDWPQFVERCREAGVMLNILGQTVNLTSARERFSSGVMALQSQYSREDMVERVQASLARRTTVLGLHHGKPCYGYRITEKGQPIAPHPDQAPIVAEVYRRYAAGESMSALAQDLNRRGVPCAQDGQLWWPNQLGRMLRNRTYLGEVRHYREWAPGQHPALVDAALFARVQRRRARRASGVVNTHAVSLSPLLVCGICGGHVTRGQYSRAHGDPPRYTCKPRSIIAAADRHPSVGISAPKVDEAIWRYAEWLLGEAGGLREALEEELRRRAADEGRGELARTRRRLREVEQQQERLLTGYRLGRIPDAIYVAQADPLREEWEELQAELAAAELPPDYRGLLRWLGEVDVHRALARARQRPAAERVEFLRRLLARVELHPGNRLAFHHLWPSDPYLMPLPPRYEPGRGIGVFPLPDD